jgi:hypothetical protein
LVRKRTHHPGIAGGIIICLLQVRFRINCCLRAILRIRRRRCVYIRWLANSEALELFLQKL